MEMHYDFHKAMNQGNIVERIYHRHRLKSILSLFNFKGKKVLDVGCNTGLIAIPISKKGAYCIGIDLSHECIKNVQKYSWGGGRVKFLVGNCTKLKFKDNYFDIVIYSAVLEHLERIEMEQTIREAKRVLKKGGCVLVTVPNIWHPLGQFKFIRKMFSGRKDIDENLDKLFTKDMLMSLFKDFKLERISYGSYLTELYGVFRKSNKPQHQS